MRVSSNFADAQRHRLKKRAKRHAADTSANALGSSPNKLSTLSATRAIIRDAGARTHSASSAMRRVRRFANQSFDWDDKKYVEIIDSDEEDNKDAVIGDAVLDYDDAMIDDDAVVDGGAMIDGDAMADDDNGDEDIKDSDGESGDDVASSPLALALASSWGTQGQGPCLRCFNIAATSTANARTPLKFKCPPARGKTIKCGARGCAKGHCSPFPGLMIGDFMEFLRWVTTVEELCTGPLSGEPAAKLAVRKALVTAAASLSHFATAHQKVFGLSGAKSNYQARARYQALVLAARGALRAGGVSSAVPALPRLEPGDLFFSRLHEEMEAMRTAVVAAVVPFVTPKVWAATFGSFDF